MSPVSNLPQAVLALAYYVALVGLIRIAGKRLAGQTSTIDLIVLISLGVVLQELLLKPGPENALVFIGVVFCSHRLMSTLTSRFPAVRRLVRGGPRQLVQNGRVLRQALEREGLSYDDLLAGLRKLGHESPDGLAVAHIEETGHITAISAQNPTPEPTSR